MRPSLDVQLKATINPKENDEGEIKYPLRRRNYDLLREETMVPRILVILSLPNDEKDWINITPDELAIRRCAYWASLSGFPESQNTDSVTITIKKENVFDVSALQSLMEKARGGSIT